MQSCREHESVIKSLREKNWDKELELLAKYKEKEKSSTGSNAFTNFAAREENFNEISSDAGSELESTSNSLMLHLPPLSSISVSSPLSTPSNGRLSPLSVASVPQFPPSVQTPSGVSSASSSSAPALGNFALPSPHVTFNLPSKPVGRKIVPTAHSKANLADDKKTIPRSMALSLAKATLASKKPQFKNRIVPIPRNKTGTIRKDDLIALGLDKNAISNIANMSVPTSGSAQISVATIIPPLAMPPLSPPFASSNISLEEDDEENCNWNGRNSTGSVKSTSSDCEKDRNTSKKNSTGAASLQQLFQLALSEPVSGTQFGV